MPRLTTPPKPTAPAREINDAIVTVSIPTPLGPMIAGAVAEGLCLLEFGGRRALRTELTDLERLLGRSVAEPNGHEGIAHLERTHAELDAYFSGATRDFGVPLCTPGTPFEQRVWDRLREIPFGTTCSYGQMAAALGSPGASRAVGRANGRNRIAIIVPCHRVIESTGALRGYGGGLERKQWLLEHEARVAGTARTLFETTAR